MEVSKSSGKKNNVSTSQQDKSNEKPTHKALYQCKECSHEARENYNLKRHMKITYVNQMYIWRQRMLKYLEIKVSMYL